jgi:hypothetical protein
MMSCYECARRLPETAAAAGVDDCPIYSLMCDFFNPKIEADAMIIAMSIARITLTMKCEHEIPRVDPAKVAIQDAKKSEL